MRYMAIDQYGRAFRNLIHPRKELCERLGKSHVSKMYRVTKDGQAKHIGYVIGGHWCEVFRVEPFKE